MITEEQYEKLIPFDKPLGCAYRANYAHIAPNDLRKVLEIYYEIGRASCRERV